MMVAVPGALPVTTPLVEPTVAILALLLLQVAPLPPAASVSVIENPTHTMPGLVIADGKGFTVTGTVIRQLVGKV